jgi:O-antigen ligase
MNSIDTQHGPVMQNRVSSVILFIVVALCPLPFGSTDPIAPAIWCIVLGVGLISTSLELLDGRHVVLVGLTLILIVVYAVVLHEQISVHPFFVGATPHSIWREVEEILEMSIEPSVSIVRNQPLLALGPPTTAMLAFLCSLGVCGDRERARQLLTVIALSGAVYAVYGIGAYIVDPSKILWREKQAYFTVLTSTFINRNTAAAYFGSCALIWLVILLEYVRSRLPERDLNWTRILQDTISRPPRRIVLAISAFFVCLSALFLTGSRGGVMVSLSMCLVATILSLRKIMTVGRKFWRTLLWLGLAVAILMQVMGAGIRGRVDSEGLASVGRLETYRATLKMIGDHPWFGTGQGTFAWSYPAYRNDNISAWGVWDRAHSTPLEVAAEMGIPLAVILCAWWLLVLGVLWHGVQTRRRDLSVPLAALCISGIALLHSTIDFSLQIPGFTIMVFALIGAGLAQSFRPRG